MIDADANTRFTGAEDRITVLENTVLNLAAIEFLVKTASPYLSAERVVDDGTMIVPTWTTPGHVIFDLVADSVTAAKLAVNAIPTLKGGIGVTHTFTTGSVVYVAAGSAFSESVNLFFDPAGPYFGIGKNNPNCRLDINDNGADRQIRVGNSAAGSAFTYNFGRDSLGYFSFYGNQTGAITYLFTGVDGEQARITSTGITAVNLSGTNTGDETAARIGALINGAGSVTLDDTDKFALAESSVLKQLTFANLKANLPGATVKIYRALVTQTGTGAPLATVLENTLGGTPTFARTGAGHYTVTLSSAFTASKTFFRIHPTEADWSVAIIRHTSTSVLDIYTFVQGFPDAPIDWTDEALNEAPLEILVYP